jgi:predicted HicB family RNase H-like nuclease
MPKLKPEPRKLGRPILPKDEAKGKIVPVRFTEAEYDRMVQAARKAEQTVSQWIRATLSEATQ